ncbi:hypothetical protein ACFOD9_05040 [Novosphingobium bradum]|uniref:Cell division protein FtsL n=1 Tax=Novosphingobium bradum TaxID=1737444 RepID=A0ABV7ILQ1_9SPHN
MMLTRSHARSIGWAVVLAVAFALTLALSFRVNAVRSQVRLTERHIAQLEAENGLLETEFETRANQQQLTALNEVEFGYQAPTAGQYLESERQLADLGKPRGPDAPAMIRVAAAEASPAAATVLPAMVNPLTGKALGAAPTGEAKAARVAAKPERLAERATGSGTGASLAERLSHVEQLAHVEKSPRAIDRKVIDRKVAGSDAKAGKPAAAKQAKAAVKPAKADPKAAKADPKQARAEPKQAKPAKVADPKLAKAAAQKAGAPKAVHVAVKVAVKGAGKARPGKSDRVAIE